MEILVSLINTFLKLSIDVFIVKSQTNLAQGLASIPSSNLILEHRGSHCVFFTE